MREFFSPLKLNSLNKDKLKYIVEIVEDYSKQGYVLTLRQLYYQLVSKDLISNNIKEYAKLSKLVVQGRLAGYIDWNAIEDRTRSPYIPYYVEGVTDAIEDTIAQYRLDRMKDQKCYIEVWVEKDALSGVLKKITSFYHVRLMVNRGYSSCTAMYNAAKRIKNYQDSKDCVILYLGDFDPSGVDMVRDIKTRFLDFGAVTKVFRVALTEAQIKKYNPPPNPAKIKDPRAKNYIAKYGNVSWEVDALDPKTLHNLVKEKIESLIDMNIFENVINQERLDILSLQKFQEDYKRN